MGFDKLDIIVGTLEAQIEKFEKTAVIAQQEMHEHQGALEAFKLLAGQMPSFANSIEERIEKDLELGSAGDHVLVYSKNIIARFMAMCEANQKNQQHQRYIFEGRFDAASQAIKDLKKEIATHKAIVERREELADKSRESYQGKSEEDVKAGFEAAAEEGEVKKVKKPRRKRRTKVQIAADKKAAAEKKAAKKN